MKIIVKLTIFVFLFISILFIPSAMACTIITASNSETVLFAGNQDQTPVNSFLVVDKTGTFGVVYFATPWMGRPLIMMKGINEKGLAYDANWLSEEKLNPHPERKPRPELLISQLMKEVSSVEEALSIIFTYNWGDSISYQVHFADKSGDAVIIHAGRDGELTYTSRPKGKDYLISTNFNIAELDQGEWFCWRYRTADKMLSKIDIEKDLSVDFMTSVLNATQQNGMWETIFSTIYDLKKLRIYLYYNRQFDKSYILDVKEELAKTKAYRKVALKDLISNRNMNKEKNNLYLSPKNNFYQTME